MRQANDQMSADQLRVLADIDEHGVHLVHVAEDGGRPGYSFTIGMPYSFDAPEVIVFGLPQDIAQDLLDAVVDEAADGTRLVADAQHADLLHGYPVKLLPVPKSAYATYLAQACWAHEGDAFDCLQLVWPDKQGRWPWSPGVRDGFPALQPILSRP